MKNITVKVPESTYIRARVWAAEHQTSVSAVVALLLHTLPESKRDRIFAAQRKASTPDNQTVTPPTPPSRQAHTTAGRKLEAKSWMLELEAVSQKIY